MFNFLLSDLVQGVASNLANVAGNEDDGADLEFKSAVAAVETISL